MPRNDKKRNHVKGLHLSRVEKIALIVIVIVAVWAVYSLSQPVPSSSQTSAGAPDFTLPEIGANGLNGQSISLSSFRGKVVLLEFMEPWCPYCQNMAPILEQLFKEYGPNVVFISVAGPWQGATAQDTEKFVQNYGSNWIYLYDSSGSIFSAYGINLTPTFFIIGKDGSVYTSLQGEQTFTTLATDLTHLIS